MRNLQARRIRRGTSLIEVLVVIVIFLTGILAVVQIFPGGFRILNTTRNNAIATQLGRSEMERLKAHADQLPEAILPVSYTYLGPGAIRIDVDSTRDTNDIGPAGGVNDISAAGLMVDAGNNALGDWRYLSGANVMRRVIGEGRRVPAPTTGLNIPSASRMVLQFGPVLLDPNYQNTFLVYGNDMVGINGLPGTAGVLAYQFFLDNGDLPTATISLPAGPQVRRYRLALAYNELVGATLVRRESVGVVVTVGANATPGAYQTFQVGAVLGIPASFRGLEPNSLRVARLFDDVSAGSFDPTNPYEYQLGPGQLGVIFFNPAGYNYEELRNDSRRVPLIARVDYDVFDWRVLREEFRIPDASINSYKLPVQSLKILGNSDTDNTTFNGMRFTVPNGAGGASASSDFVLLDVDSGGVYLYDASNPADPTPPVGPVNDYAVDPTKSSYTVNKSDGLIRFNDYDRDPSNGVQLRLLLPGAASAVTVNAAGRTVRALYMGRAEWAVQIIKAAERYSLTYGAPLSQSYYLGGASAAYGFAAPAGETAASATRIYFPNCDYNRQVLVDEIWYRRAGDTSPRSMTAVRLRITGKDSLGVYADIRDEDPLAANFDFFSYGYAARGVKGASVNVRVLWNPEFLKFNAGTPLDQFDKWNRTTRKSTTETYLQKEDR